MPLNVNFDASDSTDADLDPLTYDWDFGDGSPHGSGPTTSHTYTTPGTFIATVTVSDSRGGEDSVNMRIDVGNTAPTPTIDAPAANKLFSVGETLTLTGSATDPEDGALGDSALSWTVLRRHNTHTHPYLPATTGNNIPIVGPEPEDLSAATNSYLEIYLTATDSAGLSQTVQRDIQPKKVDISFDTIAAGLTVEVAGQHAHRPRHRHLLAGLGPDRQRSRPGRRAGPLVGVRWLVGPRCANAHDPDARHTRTPTPPSTSSFSIPGPAEGLRSWCRSCPSTSAATRPLAQHVAPLDSPSCTPAVLESPLLTISSAGGGTARARLDVIPGNVSTPADEADVRITATASDVSSSAIGTPDYTGKLIAKTTMRITDRANGPSGAVPATSQDFEFSAPVDCVATPTAGGSNCSLDTSSDALVPGFAREGKRAVISSFSMQMLDVGPDGLIAPSSDPFGLGCPPTCGSGDEKVFLRQGVFAP